MAGRNDVAIAAALEAMAQALEHQLNGGENDASCNLATFQRKNPPVFKEHKVWYGTHQLAVEADVWWLETCERLEASGEGVTWAFFRREFLRKYFLENCIKFENGLRSEIKKAVGYQKIRVFVDLVDCCRIFEEDSNAHYKMVNEKRSKIQQGRGKPYDASSGKGKQRAYEGKKTSGGDAPAGIVCVKCGKVGHQSNVCTADVSRCFRYGQPGHVVPECKRKDVVYFNCGEEGHVSTKCQKPKKEQSSGKVFALSGTQTTSEDKLI
ncbi:uncharacterized protein LOC131617019 [Vicia villosa]|uniref:uncharacterized protein LOC131617019 n=1 Tax=Vicia villosa TaxID=3911 RepID=UPI00273BD3B6|nr:uncharacterized protein LOC131617019 [Vicia villosa]